jgi:FMN-dependent NADH-azoreductase
MGNAAIPWTLKHFIDTVAQPGPAFSFDPEHGYTGLLHANRRRAVHQSRLSPGRPTQLRRRPPLQLFEYWLRYVGIQDIRTIGLQTTFPDAGLPARRNTALATARKPGHDLAVDTAARVA